MPGASMRAVARQFGYNVQNVQRHRPHLALMLEQARALREVEGLGTLYRRIKTRQEKLMAHAEAAIEKGDIRGAAALFAEARKNDEILLRLGEKPGFRETGGKTEINAPEARIVVTPSIPSGNSQM